jgi:hypothetical protein
MYCTVLATWGRALLEKLIVPQLDNKYRALYETTRLITVFNITSFWSISWDSPLLEASRDIGLEINAEKAKYMIMSRHQKSGQNQNIGTSNESFENVAKFKYLGTTLTNQNDIHDEIKSRLNSGKACCHSVQNLFYSRLISKNLKIKICKTVILPVVLYGCEIWYLTLREEHRLRVFWEQSVEEDIWTLKEGRWIVEKNCIMMNFITCILHRTLLGWLNQVGWGGGTCSTHRGGERYLQGFGW